MNKIIIYIILALFLQSFCVYKIYDGSNLKSLSYTIDQNYDASLPVSMDYFDQEMISYYSWFASYGYCEDEQVPFFVVQTIWISSHHPKGLMMPH